MEKQEKAVITVVGKDMVGILAKVSGICAEKGVNVLEVTQSILQDMFVMVMMVDITHATAEAPGAGPSARSLPHPAGSRWPR